MDNLTRVTTRQPLEVYQILKKQKTYHAKKEKIFEKFISDDIAQHYFEVYSWLNQKLGIEKDRFPIWLSVNQKYLLPLAQDFVLLELLIPTELLTFIDARGWDYRVNNCYVPLEQNDAMDFRAFLAKYGVSSEQSVLMGKKKHFYPLIRQKIMRSWDRIFTINQRSIAIVYELRFEWIQDCTFYQES